MNINQFQYGDLICRTKHSHYQNGLMTRSFIEYPMRFIRAGEDGIHLEWWEHDDIAPGKAISVDKNVYNDDNWTYWIGPRVPRPVFKGGTGPSRTELIIVYTLIWAVLTGLISGMAPVGYQAIVWIILVVVGGISGGILRIQLDKDFKTK